jgi:hypothetical protein
MQHKFRLRDENNKIVGYEKWYKGEFNMETKKDYYVANPCWLYSKDGEYWNPNFIQHRYKDQFTGLHDCEGNEIYEGDILIHELNIGKTEKLGFVIKWEKEEWCEDGFSTGFLLPCTSDQYLIIGNRYENQELLKD